MIVNPTQTTSQTLTTPEHVRESRIQAILSQSQQIPALSRALNSIDRLAIAKQTIETAPHRAFRVEEELSHARGNCMRTVLAIKQKLALTAYEKNQTLSTIQGSLNDCDQHFVRLTSSITEALVLAKREKNRLSTLQTQVEAFAHSHRQNYELLRSKLDKERIVQSNIQAKIKRLEWQFEENSRELKELQRKICDLKLKQAQAGSALKEIQAQEVSLQRGLSNLKREIKKFKDRTAQYHLILTIAAVAAVGIALIVFPPIGVAAGEEFAVSLIFTSGNTSVTLGSLGGAIVGGTILASSSEKEKTYQAPTPTEKQPKIASPCSSIPGLQDRYLPPKEDVMEMMVLHEGISTIFHAAGAIVTYPVKKAIEDTKNRVAWICHSTSFTEKQCRNAGQLYQSTTSFVKKTAVKSVELVADFSKQQVYFFCSKNQSLCNQVSVSYDDLKGTLHRKIIFPVNEWMENRSKQIDIAAQDYETRLEIPSEKTYQFYNEADSNIVIGVTTVLFSGAAKLLPFGTKPNITSTTKLSSSSPNSSGFSQPPVSDNLIAHRINTIANEKLYFPSMAEIHKASLTDLSFIWETNNKTLIGIIDEHPMPLIGFHGTNKEAIESIFSSQTSNGSLYVAGYLKQLDPITHLADLNTIRNKSLSYISHKNRVTTDGGSLLLITKDAISTDTPITHRTIYQRPYLIKKMGGRFPILECDSPMNQEILNLIERDYGQLIPKKSPINAQELLLQLKPTNFHSTVKGVLWNENSFYLPKELRDLHFQESMMVRGIMAERFKNQEFITTSFEKLGILDLETSLPWNSFYTKGETLLNDFLEANQVRLK